MLGTGIGLIVLAIPLLVVAIVTQAKRVKQVLSFDHDRAFSPGGLVVTILSGLGAMLSFGVGLGLVVLSLVRG